MNTLERTPELSSSEATVSALFRTLLGRDAEETAIQAFSRLSDVESIASAICDSTEFKLKHSSPFWHYTSTFDALALMQKYSVMSEAREGLIINFLGVAIAPKFLPLILKSMVNEVQELPRPANWHADIAEWGAVLRSVDLATDSFTMAELGCGWGCWINNACVPAKRRGLKVHAYGVEGDPGHVEFAKEACSLNGLEREEVTLYNAVASGKDGYALFPVQDEAGHAWGLEAVFDATPDRRAEAMRAGTHFELPTLSMETISEGRRLDLLHVDIQGAEVDVVNSSLAFLNSKVAYLVIGTHSRQIEGKLMETLLASGWVLEIERPAVLNVEPGTPTVSVDGVQGWRNPKLLPFS